MKQISPGYFYPKKSGMSTILPKQQSADPNWRCEIPEHTPVQKTYLAKPHICKQKTVGPQITWTTQDHRIKIPAIADKQAPCLQNNPEAYLDLCHSTVGICIKLPFGNSGDIPIKSASDTNGHPVVCAKCGDKTWLTSAKGLTRSAKLQGHLLTEAWQSSQQPGKLSISWTKLQS
jgi:hypothetical protein